MFYVKHKYVKEFPTSSVFGDCAKSREQARHIDGNARRIARDLAVRHDRHHDGAIRLTAIVQDAASPEVDDEVMHKALDAELIGQLYGLIEIAGGGRKHFDDDDGMRRGRRVIGDRVATVDECIGLSGSVHDVNLA